MCTTQSCTESWTGRSHASPRSTFPPLKCCVPAQSSKHNQSAHKPNQHPHSLKHCPRMEWHLNTTAIAGRMQFPCQPRKKTQQLCEIKVTAPQCCPQFTWKDKLHARMVPDPSPFECTSTE
ncbi:hypothetical protein TcG_12384, partial [Trypanosoma cruzi]